MVKIASTSFALLVAAMLPAQHEGAAPAPGKAARPKSAARAAKAGLASIESLPAAARERFTAFARTIEQGLRQGESDKVVAAWNTDAMVERIVGSLPTDALEDAALIEQIRSGATEGMQQMRPVLVAQWQGPHTTFKRLVIRDGEVAARFRTLQEGSGMALIDLVLAPTTDGGVSVVDIYNHANGVDVVDVVAKQILPVLLKGRRSLLQRWFGGDGLDSDDVEAIGIMARAGTQGDPAAVLRAYDGLRESARKTKGPFLLRLQALQKLEDEEGYRKALAEGKVLFGDDPSFRFVLVDYDFLRGDYAAVIAGIDAFMAAVEPDAALLALQASACNAAGDPKRGVGYVRKALALEPDCRFALEQALDVLLAAGDWAATRDCMIALEKIGGYVFKDHIDGEVWAGFRAAPESEPWR